MKDCAVFDLTNGFYAQNTPIDELQTPGVAKSSLNIRDCDVSSWQRLVFLCFEVQIADLSISDLNIGSYVTFHRYATSV